MASLYEYLFVQSAWCIRLEHCDGGFYFLHEYVSEMIVGEYRIAVFMYGLLERHKRMEIEFAVSHTSFYNLLTKPNLT